MSTRIALTHHIDLRFSQQVQLSTHWLRLRPAPHTQDRIEAYSLKVDAQPHFLNWVRDPYENYLTRLDLPEPVARLGLTVEVIAEVAPINPFNFLVEPYAFEYPFKYPPNLARELTPYLQVGCPGPLLSSWLNRFELAPGYIVERLGELNVKLYEAFPVQDEPGSGAVDLEAMLLRSRASSSELAWLLTLSLRSLGLAARVTSGYRVMLAPPTGGMDMAKLHAWTEVFLPGAGWVGLDPAGGAFTAEGYIPLASAPEPPRTVPVIGYVEACQETRSETISVRRLVPRPITWPYDESAWGDIQALGAKIDADLQTQSVNLSQGMELAFVSAVGSLAPEWNISALGPNKRQVAADLLWRLHGRMAPGGAPHIGQTDWYGGESFPRWRLGCFFRADGEPIWRNPELLGWRPAPFLLTSVEAKQFAELLAGALGVSSRFVMAAQEDGLHQLWMNRAIFDYTPLPEDLRDPERRKALAAHLSANHGEPAGYVLPLRWDSAKSCWSSGAWTFRRDGLNLIPGDSPMGYRLPLDSLPVGSEDMAEPDPERCQFEERPVLAEVCGELSARFLTLSPPTPIREPADPDFMDCRPPRTAICVQIRQGQLYVFLPPLTHLEHYLELVAAIESTAAKLGIPVMLEGYEPPEDHRLRRLSIEPEPGILKLSLPDTPDWKRQIELIQITYREAHQAGLRAERIMADGKREPPGGRADIRLGGETAAASPFLRRPQLLRSLIVYCQRHPSLSYFFAGRSIGPGGTAPRPEEGRDDALYELATALERIPAGDNARPWLADRLLRHLLADSAGDMKRAEIRIDRLYSPESSSLRQGRILLRAFETPPDAGMAALQLLLVNGLLAYLDKSPQPAELIDWRSALHDRFMLPGILWDDFKTVLRDLDGAGYPFQAEWFEPFLTLRFPVLGRLQMGDISLELRHAHEPWPVLAEEVTAAGVARFIDSANGRVEVRCSGLSPSRFALVCNGHRTPLQDTQVPGESVAGVRFKSSNPPATLHPTKLPVECLVFDLVDLWTGKVVGGCTYYPPRPPLWGPVGVPPVASEISEGTGAERQTAAQIIPASWSGGGGGAFIPKGSGLKYLSPPPLAIDNRFPYLLDLVRMG